MEVWVRSGPPFLFVWAGRNGSDELDDDPENRKVLQFSTLIRPYTVILFVPFSPGYSACRGFDPENIYGEWGGLQKRFYWDGAPCLRKNSTGRIDTGESVMKRAGRSLCANHPARCVSLSKRFPEQNRGYYSLCVSFFRRRRRHTPQAHAANTVAAKPARPVMGILVKSGVSCAGSEVNSSV